MKSNGIQPSSSASLGTPAKPPDWRITKHLRQAGVRALDLLLPPRCAACDAAVGAHGQLCAECFGRTNFISAPVCARCGVPFSSVGQGGLDGGCPGCMADPPVFQAARAALRYDDQARKLILPLKHGDRVELAAILAPMMVRAGRVLLAQAEVLVPVPLHRSRLFHRKYNQAAVLALAIGRLTGHPVLPDALCRTRRTSALEDKSPEERAEEVEGSFLARPARGIGVAGRRVLLIDDVMTSGSTANACSAALLAAGAVTVDVLVAARVPDPKLN